MYPIVIAFFILRGRIDQSSSILLHCSEERICETVSFPYCFDDYLNSMGEKSGGIKESFIDALPYASEESELFKVQKKKVLLFIISSLSLSFSS